MSIEFSKAADALNKAAKLGGSGGLAPRETPETGSFADLVKQVSEEAMKAGQVAEQKTEAAVQDKAELTDVVTAIANAEVTLQTVVAVRDRIISAYQEILRMPI